MFKPTAATTTPVEYIDAIDEPRRIALASQKRYISLYVTAADLERGYLAESYRRRLPKADIGRSCVRFKRLKDVDLDVIAELVRAGADFKPRAEAS